VECLASNTRIFSFDYVITKILLATRMFCTGCCARFLGDETCCTEHGRYVIHTSRTGTYGIPSYSVLVGYTDIRRLKTEISSIYKTVYVHCDVGRVLASVRASVASWRTYLREEI
jgi:hypothetical protein